MWYLVRIAYTDYHVYSTDHNTVKNWADSLATSCRTVAQVVPSYSRLDMFKTDAIVKVLE